MLRFFTARASLCRSLPWWVLGWSLWASAAAAVTRPIDRVSPPDATIDIQEVAVSELEVTVDGRLDEAVWQRLPSIGHFETIEPDTLAPGKHPTQLRIFYSDRGIYVGFDLHQPKDTLMSRLSSRDQRSINRDAVFITLDSSGEGRYGYWFGIALGGSLLDGTLLPERRYSGDWDGPWWGATAETEDGWSAEMFIPWSVMSMPQREDKRRIGVYVSRKVAYLDERWAWPALPSSKPQFISVFDQLEVDDVAPRQQYNLFPYASSTVKDVADETNHKAGADFFWRPSTDFQLAATLNPDFGSVESDDVIVNLSATETFFPEKRLFFLEGQEVFVATPRASGGRPTTLLNTRRIGGRAFAPDIPDDVTIPAIERGQPADLLGALKATGQVGAMRYGVITAMEDETVFEGTDNAGREVTLKQDGRDYAVTRLAYEDYAPNGATRGLGWMSTAVTHPERDAYVHALDGHYLTDNGQWQWDGQVIHSDIDVEGEGSGGFVDVQYTPSKNHSHKLETEYFDEEININDLGFLRRNDLFRTRYRYSWRSSDISFARNASMQAALMGGWNSNKRRISNGFFGDASVTTNDLSRWQLNTAYIPSRFEDLDSFGNGTYRIDDRTRIGVEYETDSTRRLTAEFGLRYEEENLDGDSVRAEIEVTYNPFDRLTTGFEVTYRKRNGWLLHQTDRDMTTFNAEEWRYEWDFDFFFTAHQQFRASLQWVGIRAFEKDFYVIPEQPGRLIPTTKAPDAPSDNFTISTLNFQLRYRWEMAPMSDLFVVYTKNGNQASSPANNNFNSMFDTAYHEPLAEQLVVKLRYRLGN